MRKLCAIFAHPDDETFSAGGTLARYADAGVEITLVTATSGEAGEVGSAPVERSGLGAWRERELFEAAGVLGIKTVRLLRLSDGRLEGLGDELAASFASVLEETKPQVVITEDVQGITGHPDHIAVARAVLRAFDGLAESSPLKLYEHVLPASLAPPGMHGTPDDYITTILNVESWRDRKLAALRAHRSQVGEEMLALFEWFPAPFLEQYVCVRTRVPILIPEDDLFAGVPA